MARRNIGAVLGLLLALIATSASAQSGCGGQAAAGRVCGNAAATTGLPSLGTVTALLDRAFGTTQGTMLNRGASVWTETAAPVLGGGGVGGSVTLSGSLSGTAVIQVPAAAGTGTVFQLPSTNGTNGYVLSTDGAGATSWINNTAGGTVQSVGLSMPGIFSVSGSPVILTGTLTATLATQSPNLVWAGPNSGGAATPTFRSLVGADLPNPSATTLGGIQSFVAVGSQWIRQISTSGVPTASQPAFMDISGTLAAAQCPNPSASTLGCVQSLAAVTSKWISTISTSGVPTATQPAFTDISGAASLSQLPSIGNNVVLGNNSGGTAIPSALSASNVLDMVGSTRGSLLYRGASGWSILAPGTSGFVLSSNGAGADPSYISVGGTGTVQTLTSGSGILFSSGATCTTNCTVSLATITTGTVLANVTGGSAAPIANTPSAVLDLIGSTQGNILYRGASNWLVLAPGTNGQVLTQGASTPAWGSAGSVSNVTLSAGTGIGTSGTCTITTTGTCTVALSTARQTLPTVSTVTGSAHSGGFAANTSGTYTTPANALWIEIEIIGGGAGGNGASGPSAAGASCWNTTGAACTTPVYSAGGGTGAAGGAIAGSSTCNIAGLPGGAGNGGVSTTASTSSSGGIGGSSTLGGAGVGVNAAGGGNAVPDSGSGGGGGGVSGAVANSAGGGGAGATCRVIITSPASTYTYAVGAGTAGGATGGVIGNGGNGAGGRIIVKEHYGS